MKKLIKTILSAGILSAVVLIAVSPLGCRATVEGIHLLEGDFTVPKILSVEVSNASSITLNCSKPVSVTNASVSKITGGEDFMEIKAEQEQSGKNLTLNFPKSTSVGEQYALEGTLVDSSGNTLTFSIPFTGFNERIPALIFSEVRNASDSKKNKHEYVEFYSLSEGNLAGLEFVSAYDGETKKYVFPPCEVKAGEFITLHLRKPTNDDGSYVEEGMTDELTDDLTLSFAGDSCPTARDLWVENTAARIAPSDILILRNTLNGTIVDALLFAESKTASWNKKYADYEALVLESGIWRDSEGNASSSIESAFCSDSMTTVTRSISRQNISSLVVESYSVCAGDWLLVGSKGGKTNECTPGLPNSSNKLP